jgi:MoaA/NifB/PqqE/SkfB family radical SAM enzyme
MDITLTMKCNNNCVFCPRREHLKIIACRSLKDVYADIERTRRKDDKITLAGGEVTLLDDLNAIVRFCKDKGFKSVGVITNGRRLKDAKFAESLVRAGADDFAVSIYSVDNKIHDLITRRPGSARDTKKGLANLIRLSKKYPISVRVNTVLSRWNYRGLPATLETLSSYGVRNFIVAEQIVTPKRSAHLSISQTNGSLKKIMGLSLENTRLVLRGFPFCLIGRGGTACKEGIIIKPSNPLIILEKQNLDTLVKGRGKKSQYLSDLGKLFTKADRCRSCAVDSRCHGIQKAYF